MKRQGWRASVTPRGARRAWRGGACCRQESVLQARDEQDRRSWWFIQARPMTGSSSSVARLLGCAGAGLEACWLAGLGAWVLGCLLGYTSVGPYAVVWRRQQGRYWVVVAIASLSLKPSGTQAATGFTSAVLLSAGIHVHVALRQQPRLHLAPV
jgi:hypothetical protein